jgi:hypothetical protein
MHGTSEGAQNGQSEERPQAAAPAHDTPQTPLVDSPPTSPPTSPQSSPWWTAPGGKAVDIPDFGHVLFDALAALLAPAPQPLPLRIRARR